MKTARFTELVEKAGAPKPHLLWVSPKQDPAFQRALKEQRILTIHQENVGTKKDYGMVGFHDKPNAQYLIFPKSLKVFAERRIIGINYDLLAKESRAGKPPVIERRVPATRATKKVAQKSISKGSAPSGPEDAADKIVAFEKPAIEPAAAEEHPTPSTRAGKNDPRESPADDRVIGVVRRAMKDLDAGKTVAAYKRLESLVTEAEAKRS